MTARSVVPSLYFEANHAPCDCSCRCSDRRGGAIGAAVLWPTDNAAPAAIVEPTAPSTSPAASATPQPTTTHALAPTETPSPEPTAKPTDVPPTPTPTPHLPAGSTSLDLRQSWNPVTGEKLNLRGGSFYFTVQDDLPWLFTNNTPQKVIIDLGALGETDLSAVVAPALPDVCEKWTCDPYVWWVEAIPGHTYVALAPEGFEGHFVYFRVTAASLEGVTFDYHYD